MERSQSQQSSSPISRKVFARIKGEGIEPKSKWLCLCQSWLLRLLWMVSIVIGAVAVAVSLFSFLHSGYAFYEATHENAYTLLVETLPLLWLLVLALTLMVAVHYFRHVDRGYRYSFTVITGSSVLLSLVGGVLLHLSGVGQLVDTKLAEAMPMYRSQESRELTLWQQPESGRLVGVMVGFSPSGTSTAVLFEDAEGERWHVLTMDLHQPDLELLLSERQVRLLGLLLEERDHRFHVCGVFPWLYDTKLMFSDLSEHRKDFIERMYAHMDYAKERAKQFEADALAHPTSGTLCAELSAVRRIGESMQ